MDIKNSLREAGIVGAGGAGFPSYAKLADGADMLLINAAECEPLLLTDFFILSKELTTVCDGARLLADAMGIQTVMMCVKKHNAEQLGWKNDDILPSGIVVRELPDVYPMGDEINLIYESTGRLVQPGCLPISEGVIVYNVETLYNVARAMRLEIPVVEKWLTIAGDIPLPQILRVPIGTPVSYLFEQLKIKVPETHVVIDGGPSMGQIINPLTAVVGKTTKAILILPREIPAVSMKTRSYDRHVAIANSVCCQCTNCTEMCPRALLGYPLEPHRMVRAGKDIVKTMPEEYISALLCCGCGICELAACCQFISPKEVIAGQKQILSQKGIRYPKDKPKVKPSADRAERMVPVSRWMSLLGVSKFHRTSFSGGALSCDEVTIEIHKHIGASAIPSVSIGDEVKVGQVIAKAADGLSVFYHASIDGIVTYCDADRICIRHQ